jgi:O-antigen/teichoic acid export membrane protein
MRKFNLFNNTLIYSAYNIGVRGMNYIIVPIIATVLSKDDFGRIGIILSVSTLFSFSMNFGIDNSINRFFHDDNIKPKAFLSTYLFVSLIITSVVSLLLIFGITITSYFYSFPISLVDLAFAFIFALTLVYIKTYERVLKADGHAQTLAIFGLKRTLLKSLLLVSIVFFIETNYIGYFYALITSSTIFFIYAVIMLLHKCKISFDRNIASKIYNYSRPLIPNRLVAFLVEPLHQFLTLSLDGLSNAGLLFIANSITKPINILCNAFIDSFTPWAYNQMKMKSDKQIIRKYAINIIITVSVLCFVISILIGDFVKILFKNEFENIGLILNFFVFYSLINLIKNVNLSLLLHNKKRTSLVQWPTYINLIVNALLGIYLISILGYMGSGIAMFVSRLISGSLTYYYASKHTDINIGWKYVIMLPLMLLSLSIFISLYIKSIYFKIFIILAIMLLWIKYFGGLIVLKRIFKKLNIFHS